MTQNPATDDSARSGQPAARAIKTYYVFLASPGDVADERQAVRDFFTTYNQTTAETKGLRFELVDWENYSTAGVGRPQELITKQTLERHKGSLALVIGILGQRFGSPSGKRESGTLEEFGWALKSNNESGYPEVKWFFKDIKNLNLDPDRAEQGLEQWNRVKAFRRSVEDGKSVYTRSYNDLSSFQSLLNQDVTRWLNDSDRDWNSSESFNERPADPEPAPVVFWHLRPSTNAENFYGRQDQLEELDRHFEHGKTFVISAGPGIGKSRLAAEWSVRSGMNGFWTRGGDTAVHTLASLGRELGFEDATDDELSQRTSSWLSQNDSILWVVDDLKDLAQVRELERVSSGGKLLVTTRSAEFGYLPDGTGRSALTTLTPGASVELLSSKIAVDGHDDVLKQIAEQVGYLPLALEMLAVRLGNNPLLGNQPGLLLEQLKKKPNTAELEIFQEEAKGTSLPRDESVFQAISGTITELDESAREKLMSLGYMADALLPQRLAMTLMGVEQGELVEVIGECQRQSVLRLSDAGDALVVHSLTAAVIRSIDQGKSLGEASSRLQENLAERVNDYSIDLGNEVVHHVRMLEHLQAAEDGADPGENRLNYAAWLSRGYSRLGRYQEAVDLDQETLRLSEKVFGPEHPITLTSRNNLASGSSRLGHYQEAVELHEETLTLYEKVLGPEHPNTLTSRNNLAQGYSNLGRYQDAVELHEETLRLREKVLGPEHPETLTSRNNLAQGYSNLGRYQEAVELQEGTLRLREKMLGPEHPDTLNSRNNLAQGYSNFGRYREAVELYEEALRLSEKVLGRKHPDTLTSRNNLASGYSNLGRYQEAVDLDQETLRLHEEVLGPEHPDTLASRNNLAQGYSSLGRYQEAVELHEETLRLKEHVLGPEHPDTLNSRNNLASGYFRVGRYREAVELHEETLRLSEKVLGPAHPNTLTKRNNLASGYTNLGRYQDAVDLNEETLRLSEKLLGPEHPNTLGSRNNLASGYSRLDRNQEAVELHEETLRLQEEVLGPEHPDTLASRNNLASGYYNLGRYQEAVELDEETLRLKEKVLGEEHSGTLISRNNLAQVYAKLGRYQEAVELHEETLRLYEKVLGPEHPNTLISRGNLAQARELMGG